jgi:large subunit ribosomal protein L35
MPKTKTHKGATKRIKRTGSGKLVHRTSGHGHFNSRERGNTTRNKRTDSGLAGVNSKLGRVISK